MEDKIDWYIRNRCWGLDKDFDKIEFVGQIFLQEEIDSQRSMNDSNTDIRLFGKEPSKNYELHKFLVFLGLKANHTS